MASLEANDAWVFGHDPKPGIVSVYADRSGQAIIWRRLEGRLVVERARNLCEYCRYPGRYAPQTPPVDHVIPQDAGGKTTAENLAHCCQGCNGGMNTLRGVKIICVSPG